MDTHNASTCFVLIRSFMRLCLDGSSPLPVYVPSTGCQKMRKDMSAKSRNFCKFQVQVHVYFWIQTFLKFFFLFWNSEMDRSRARAWRYNQSVLMTNNFGSTARASSLLNFIEFSLRLAQSFIIQFSLSFFRSNFQLVRCFMQNPNFFFEYSKF